MPLTDDEIKIIKELNQKAKDLYTSSHNDVYILTGMADDMTKVKLLLGHTDQTALDICVAQHPYFYRFMKLLEKVARGIAGGEIEVPE